MATRVGRGKRRHRARMACTLFLTAAFLIGLPQGAEKIPLVNFFGAGRALGHVVASAELSLYSVEYGKTKEGSTNVRKEATTKSDLVVRIKVAETPVLIAYETVNAQEEGWYYVEFGAYTGFIRADLIEPVSQEEYMRLHDRVAGTPVETLFTRSSASSEEAERYIGNVLTNKFHRQGCYSLPDAYYQVSFSSRDDAVAGGYIPCKNCMP